MKPKKVLIVDDHAEIRKLIRITLGKNVTTLEAADGPTALDVIRAHHPDVVVLDVMMPGNIDGLGVLDAIRADQAVPQPRVIMVMARGQARDYADGMARGADRYFIKPFSPLELAAAIREYLQ